MLLAVLTPIAVFSIWYVRSKSFREYVLSLTPRTLTIIHSERIGGLVFLAMYTYNILPGMLALPAGWGDIAIGATAYLGCHQAGAALPAGLHFMALAWNTRSRSRSQSGSRFGIGQSARGDDCSDDSAAAQPDSGIWCAALSDPAHYLHCPGEAVACGRGSPHCACGRSGRSLVNPADHSAVEAEMARG